MRGGNTLFMGSGPPEQSTRPRMARGYSLVELAVVTAISAVLFTLALPPLSKRFKDSQFLAFAGELTGNLKLARRFALHSGWTVAMDLQPTANGLYRTYWLDGEERKHELARADPATRYRAAIRNDLPTAALPHPTSGGALTSPLSSTHAPRIVFAGLGSSNATLVFSDDEGRALCAVISGRSGRFRVYLWQKEAQRWLAFY